MSDTAPIFRCRWLLELRQPVTLPPWQHGVVTGLIKAANSGDGTEAPTGFPLGMVAEAPEVGRTELEKGDIFAFGATFLGPGGRDAAAATLHRLCRGLLRLGATRPRRPAVLGGNFALAAVEDTVAGRDIGPGDRLVGVPHDLIAAEIARCRAIGPRLTLRFPVPYRSLLPGQKHRKGSRQFVGRDGFVADQFLNAVSVALRESGIDAGRSPRSFPPGAMTIEENRLDWLAIHYGSEQKDLSGAVGDVDVLVDDPATLDTLTWGQYVAIGKNVNFGLGRYRIVEAGPNTTACRRTASLLELATRPGRVEAAAMAAGLSPREVSDAVERLRDGRHLPSPPTRLMVADADGSPRELSVPSALDRCLQRLLAAILAPAFDRLFEDSSFAWRRKLSRGLAAGTLSRHAADGWLHAVQADIDRFFPSVPRTRLARRLAAWVAGDPIGDAALTLVGNGPGLPTGAPLSPLLGNMFLDDFDEQVAARGGRLVRYADDFLVLTRSREAAEILYGEVRHLAAQLELRLNDGAGVIDLREGFRFLGYDFTWAEGWRADGPDGPWRTGHLGWRDADRVPALSSIPLAGESAGSPGQGVVVIGAGTDPVEIRADELVLGRDPMSRRVSLATIDTIVHLGPLAWKPEVAGRLLRDGIHTCLVSAGGWPLGDLSSTSIDDPSAILAQSEAVRDRGRTLGVARALVRAKLENVAALCDALGHGGTAVAGDMRLAAKRVDAMADLEALRGLEGAAARGWYAAFADALGGGFTFPGRIAPDATDPVNVLLNIGHSMVHRLAINAIRAAGLSPALGFLHAPTPRFAALAADLQEPFRHLVERAVILATRRLAPRHFIRSDDGDHPLALEPLAAKTFHALLQRSIQAGVMGRGQTEPRAWVAQIHHTARSLRRHLVDAAIPFEPFEHATPEPLHEASAGVAGHPTRGI